MKCTKAQRCLLLHDSGELKVSTLKALEQHLASCPDCQARHQDNQHLLAHAATDLHLPQPGNAALEAVHSRARACAGSGATRRLPRHAWPGLLTLAASALLMFGWLTVQNTAHRQTLNRIHAVMALIEDPLVQPDQPRVEPVNRQDALRQLGEELLWSQGLLDFDTDLNGA